MRSIAILFDLLLSINPYIVYSLILSREKEHYESLRRRGNDVARARHEAEALLEDLPSEAASKTTAALEAAFRAHDKSGTGVLQSKEFEAAVKQSGLPMSAEKVKITILLNECIFLSRTLLFTNIIFCFLFLYFLSFLTGKGFSKVSRGSRFRYGILSGRFVSSLR